MSGPAMVDLIIYYAIGYVGFPVLVVMAAVREKDHSTKAPLLWTIPAVLIGSPIAYRLTGAVHVPVLGVWNLAVGPASVILLATGIARLGIELTTENQ